MPPRLFLHGLHNHFAKVILAKKCFITALANVRVEINSKKLVKEFVFFLSFKVKKTFKQKISWDPINRFGRFDVQGTSTDQNDRHGENSSPTRHYNWF